MHFHWVGETSDKFALCRCDGCRLEPSPGFPPLKTTEWKRPQWKNKMCRRSRTSSEVLWRETNCNSASCLLFWNDEKRFCGVVMSSRCAANVNVTCFKVATFAEEPRVRWRRLPSLLQLQTANLSEVPSVSFLNLIVFTHNDKHTEKHSHQHADTCVNRLTKMILCPRQTQKALMWFKMNQKNITIIFSQIITNKGKKSFTWTESKFLWTRFH